MKTMTCPLNGPRNINEFVCAGEAKTMPSPNASPLDWARYAYQERNIAGVVLEWWLHVPSANWFVAERDTRDDRIIRTMTVAEFAASGGATT
jgi:sarcosine oxidase, subunit delta